MKIVTIGGSVTTGAGLHNYANTWTTRVYDWIRAAFPHEEHDLTNKAIGAVTSAYFAPCISSTVPADVDAVFMVSLSF